jgi:RNA-directed DNA polymerase
LQVKLKLVKTPDEIREAFKALSGRASVARLLEVPDQHLIWHLYRFPEQRRSKVISIPKRTGGVRLLMVPGSRIKILQRKLADVLSHVYSTPRSVHGFVLDANVRSNAAPHRGQPWVLKVDLEDFFPSINFGRVRGMFMSAPYSIGERAATVLAQLCCWENQLPQGAPTSPIVSNMVCRGMDRTLRHLARKHKCVVSRYADDITFSTPISTLFPSALAKRVQTADGFVVTPGPALIQAIDESGFRINSQKLRLRGSDQRQIVTGVIVNRKLSPPREYVRRVRAMLHAWRRYGLVAAEGVWRKEFDVRRRLEAGTEISFRRVVEGRLAYLAMVRGTEDAVVKSFRAKLSKLLGEPEIPDAVWVIETKLDSGTGFFLDGVGFVTCAHVVRDGPAVAFRADAPDAQYPVRVRHMHRDADLAICEVQGLAVEPHALAGRDAAVTVKTEVYVLGFPNWARGNTIYRADGAISQLREHFGFPSVLVTAQIVQGNSGGPIVDVEGRVIAIARKGQRFVGDTDADHEESSGILVSALHKVAKFGPDEKLIPV